MSSRALKIAFAYLKEKQKFALTEPEEGTEEQILSDVEVSQAANDALETFYPAYLGQWMRNSDLASIFTYMTYVVNQFNSSSSPQQQLISQFSSFKNKILSNIEEVAKSDSNSIKETVESHFKANPASSVEEVEDYMKSFLLNIKNTTKRQIPKWKEIT